MNRNTRCLSFDAAAWILGTVFAIVLSSCRPNSADHAVPEVAWKALADADRYQVFSIEPGLPEGGLDHYRLLGKVTVVDRATQSSLDDALERTAWESKGWAAGCFNPRHGIRVTSGGATTDLVICFECMQVEVWQGGKQVAHFSTNDSAQPLFDAVLKKAGIPLAPK